MIWDTAGQPKFRTVTQLYLKRADGVLVLYGVHDRNSYDNVCRWMETVDEHCPESIPRIVVGIKGKEFTDEARQVSLEEGMHLGDQFRCPFFECSVGKGTNICEAFCALAKLIFENKLPHWDEASQTYEQAQQFVNSFVLNRNESQARD